MNYYLGIDIAKTNHVASLINNNGDIVIRAIKFTNSKTLYPVLFKLNDFYNRTGYKVNVVCDFNPYNQI